MGNPLTKHAYNKMLAEDIDWLETCTNHSIEKMHILTLLREEKAKSESSRSASCSIVKLQDAKTVWVAWTNTDCTEGRGRQIPKAVCEKEATAVRLGKKGSVQGGDCEVTECLAVRVNDRWLVPGDLKPESKEDVVAQTHIDAKRSAREKAKAAGLTEEDLILLGG